MRVRVREREIHQMSPDELNETSDGEEDFLWDDYLKETNAEPAPASCFCQHATPPQNEFKEGNKLETFDPRNTTSTCIGTVIETSGSRIRLRLDGTDDRNDFWLMVDSDLIHPYLYSAKHGRKIQPPLGFGNDLSKWPRFLERIISSTDSNVFASESCFKQTPSKPQRNEFKCGQKLEAVDPKNPHLICPATIKEVNRDKILITFDGWSQSSQTWISFTSRDIFPCGFCKQSKHLLQHPGNLLNDNNVGKAKSLPHIKQEAVKTHSAKLNASKSIINKSSKKSKKPNETNDVSLNSSGGALNSTELNQNENVNQFQQSQNSRFLNADQKEDGKIDLSIVKQEAFDLNDDAVHLKSVNLNSNGEINNLSHNYVTNKSTKLPAMNALVHLIPNGSCGKYIKTEKFHQSHTKFGPGSPSTVYKSIVQSFVDCAFNRYEVFKLIPEGTSHDIVRLKNTNYNERKRLVLIEDTNEMWSNLKTFCKLLGIEEEKLFSKHKPTISNEAKRIETNEPTSVTITNENNVSNFSINRLIESKPALPLTQIGRAHV